MTAITRASLLAAALAGVAMVLPAVGAAAAQEPGARRGTGLTSPDVAPDRRVTFRLRAPEAKAVTVSGDFGADAAMRKGDDGVWSGTIGPLDPEMYVYYFTVDGVRLTDPSNPQVKHQPGLAQATRSVSDDVGVPVGSPQQMS
jgi:enterochelin esterase family protein